MFERFYRVDFSRTRESGGGAGLGMAIVAAIVGAHQGAVEIAETPGGGTTVRVTLPLDPAAMEPEPEEIDDDEDAADASEARPEQLHADASTTGNSKLR